MGLYCNCSPDLVSLMLTDTGEATRQGRLDRVVGVFGESENHQNEYTLLDT